MQHLLNETNTSFSDIEPAEQEKLWSKVKETEKA